MRIGQVKAEFLDIVEALVDVKVVLDVTPVQIERPECCPWAVSRGQIPASVISCEAKNSADASKNVNLHDHSVVAIQLSADGTRDDGS